MVVANQLYHRHRVNDAGRAIVSLRALASRYRREAEHCSLRGDWASIAHYEGMAERCEIAAGQLEGRQ